LSQFAVLGLAAMFLMVLMMGGLTSLLLLAHNNQSGISAVSNASKIILPASVEQVPYTTTTLYQHVASAVADHTYIYYTAYGDGLNNPWMLERLDRTTGISTPLQGIWFIQNSLLVAMTDSKGTSHLLLYQLDTTGKLVAKEIATAIPGHILTSPTANSDGSQIYWSEEWSSSAGTLNSNIWT